MTYFCPVVGCRVVHLDEAAALLQDKRCPVHQVPLKGGTTVRRDELNLKPGTSPNEEVAIRSTMAQGQRPLLPQAVGHTSPPPLASALPLASLASPTVALPTIGPQPLGTGSGVATPLNFASLIGRAATAGPSAAVGSPTKAVSGGEEYGGLSTFKCRHCRLAAGAADHVATLPESAQTREMATKFVAACLARQERMQDALKGSKDGPQGFMLGILQLGKNFYCAISGRNSVTPGVRSVALKLGMTYIDDMPKQVTASGRAISTEDFPQTGVAGFFECAGPKLVGHILDKLSSKTGLHWHMTEMWCGPSATHSSGQVYASCGNCKLILPMMLCLARA